MHYVIFARRSKRTPWTEWSQANDIENAEKLYKFAIDSGYESTIETDCKRINEYRRIAKLYYFDGEDELDESQASFRKRKRRLQALKEAGFEQVP